MNATTGKEEIAKSTSQKDIYMYIYMHIHVYVLYV